MNGNIVNNATPTDCTEIFAQTVGYANFYSTTRYKRYEVQLEKTKSSNREAESDFVTEVGGMNHIEPGSEWDRVSKHCDFSAKVDQPAKEFSILPHSASYRRLATRRTCPG